MKYISHLDMTRVMSRAIRRAKLPVWFTEGFNQHLYINFALPLSLGFESLSEGFDIRVMDDGIGLDEIKKRLSETVPEGITVTEVCEPQRKFKEIAFAEFRILLRSRTKSSQDVKTFLQRDTIMCSKRTKKGDINQIELKEKLRGYSVSDDASGNIVLTMTIAAGSSDNVNPMLVIDALNTEFCDAFTVLSVVRTELFDGKMQIFR